MGKNSDSGKDKSKAFTVDSEGSGQIEMPSITTLLDRKSGSKLIKMRKEKEAEKTRVLSKPPMIPEKTQTKQGLKKDTPTEEGIQIGLDASAPTGIQFSYSSNSPAPTPAPSPAAPEPVTRVLNAPPEVQKSKRAGRAVKDIVKWDLKTIQSGQDPLYLALQKIIKNGGKHSLFLNVHVADATAAKVVFESSAGYGEAEHLRLWKGMKWDPHVVPELWNHFVKHGASELSPPGTVTHLASSRNVVRGVFGAKRDEWLTLFRVGPAKSCRGILAVLSKNTLQPFHTDILQSLKLN